MHRNECQFILGEYSKLFIFTVRRLTKAMNELDEDKMDAAKAN